MKKDDDWDASWIWFSLVRKRVHHTPNIIYRFENNKVLNFAGSKFLQTEILGLNHEVSLLHDKWW